MRYLDKLPFPRSLTGYAGILRALRREVGEDALFVLFPNTKDDVQLCLAATFVSARTCVWVMDDFVSMLFPDNARRGMVVRHLFRKMYLRAGRCIAVSRTDASRIRPPLRQNSRPRAGKALAPRSPNGWFPQRAPSEYRQPAPNRLGSASHYQPYYHEPIVALSKLLRGRPNIPAVLDLQTAKSRLRDMSGPR